MASGVFFSITWVLFLCVVSFEWEELGHAHSGLKVRDRENDKDTFYKMKHRETEDFRISTAGQENILESFDTTRKQAIHKREIMRAGEHSIPHYNFLVGKDDVDNNNKFIGQPISNSAGATYFTTETDQKFIQHKSTKPVPQKYYSSPTIFKRLTNINMANVKLHFQHQNERLAALGFSTDIKSNDYATESTVPKDEMHKLSNEERSLTTAARFVGFDSTVSHIPNTTTRNRQMKRKFLLQSENGTTDFAPSKIHGRVQTSFSCMSCLELELQYKFGRSRRRNRRQKFIGSSSEISHLSACGKSFSKETSNIDAANKGQEIIYKDGLSLQYANGNDIVPGVSPTHTDSTQTNNNAKTAVVKCIKCNVFSSKSEGKQTGPLLKLSLVSQDSHRQNISRFRSKISYNTGDIFSVKRNSVEAQRQSRVKRRWRLTHVRQNDDRGQENTNTLSFINSDDSLSVQGMSSLRVSRETKFKFMKNSPVENGKSSPISSYIMARSKNKEHIFTRPVATAEQDSKEIRAEKVIETVQSSLRGRGSVTGVNNNKRQKANNVKPGDTERVGNNRNKVSGFQIWNLTILHQQLEAIRASMQNRRFVLKQLVQYRHSGGHSPDIKQTRPLSVGAEDDVRQGVFNNSNRLKDLEETGDGYALLQNKSNRVVRVYGKIKFLMKTYQRHKRIWKTENKEQHKRNLKAVYSRVNAEVTKIPREEATTAKSHENMNFQDTTDGGTQLTVSSGQEQRVHTHLDKFRAQKWRSDEKTKKITHINKLGKQKEHSKEYLSVTENENNGGKDVLVFNRLENNHNRNNGNTAIENGKNQDYPQSQQFSHGEIFSGNEFNFEDPVYDETGNSPHFATRNYKADKGEDSSSLYRVKFERERFYEGQLNAYEDLLTDGIMSGESRQRQEQSMVGYPFSHNDMLGRDVTDETRFTDNIFKDMSRLHTDAVNNGYISHNGKSYGDIASDDSEKTDKSDRLKRSITLSFNTPKPSVTSSWNYFESPSSVPLPTSTLPPSSLAVLKHTNLLSDETTHTSPSLGTVSPQLSLVASSDAPKLTNLRLFPKDCFAEKPVESNPVLKIGVILPFRLMLPWIVNKTRPAIEMAADKVKSADGTLPGYDIQIEFRDSQCSETFGPLHGIDLYMKNLAHVFIGPSCDYSIAPLARFSYYWGIPILTAGALVDAFEKKDEYRLLTRMQGSYTKSAEFFISIAVTYGWSTVGIVFNDLKFDGRVLRSNCAFTIEPIFYSVEVHLKTKPWHVAFNEKEAEDDTIISLLKQLPAKCRIVVLCASSNTVREIMIKAHDLNFDNGEYVFFNIDLFSSKNASESPWYRADDTEERNAKARKAYESLMTVTLRMPTSSEYRQFSNDVKARAAEMYPNFTYGEDEVNSFVGAFHDAVLLYALALNETLADNGSISDGQAITRRMWNRTFTGITGNVSIDANGDRNADYSLLDLNPETGKFEVVANYFGNKRKYEPVPGKSIHWAGGRQAPPPDTPKCGFDGSKCPPDEPFPEYAIVIIVLGSLLLIVLIAVLFIYRHIKLEAELAEMNWRVRWDDILFGAVEKNKKLERQGSRISLVKSSLSSGCSGDTIAVHLNDASNRQLFTRTGYYKGAIVAIKPIIRSNITVTKPMLLEIKRMKDLQNDHIVRFIGACTDYPNNCILTEYCPKGSLQDVLENEQIKLDWMFRYSIMQDIVRGMAYLQSTEIHSHGSLKSTNCVVDSRFVVKITDFGLHHLRGITHANEDDEEKYSYFQSKLWTAPELLRMAYHIPEGTIKGDVYSFAIICQEIVYRNGVFYLQNLDLSPQEIFQKVKVGLKPYFRPTLEEYDCPCDELAGVIRRCWSEDPADRPDFQALKSIIRKLNREGDKGNILDNLLSRMEQYANNLEALVEERTADYLQQKRKAEDLLYNMLPKKVASQLIRGESVTAEWYDSVSIYFSDICGFTAMSAESTPMEVVDLLNDLYTTFDSIIENFDVYKVETIGDAYMVVSGLPDRNGHLHAREIARMSLSLLKATLTFRIRHRPNDQLKIRIGIHTGPVCAGVVGLKMPRYCLFGDTVNTASRMESNGLPLRIHVSPQCKEVLDSFSFFELELRGNVEMKGKGQVKTYWLIGEKNTSDSPGVSLNIL